MYTCWILSENSKFEGIFSGALVATSWFISKIDVQVATQESGASSDEDNVPVREFRRARLPEAQQRVERDEG